jgi:branched-chain amino acid transport system permease protein
VSRIRLGALLGSPVLRVVAVAILVLALPIVVQDVYSLSTATGILMFALPALCSWLLLTAGLWSFGQGLFALIGSYGVTLLVMRLGMPFWVAMPLSAVLAATVAWVIAFPALRASGVAFAILTMVGLLAAYQVVTVFSAVTGGAGGIVGVPPPDDLNLGPVAISVGSPSSYYYLIAILFVLCLASTQLIARSHVFLEIRGLAANPRLAASVGIPPRRVFASVLAFAAFWTAIAGAFSAPYLGVAHPLVWYIYPSIFIVAYPIIGGISSLYGALLGTIAIVAGSEVLRLTQQVEPILVGVGLLAITLFLPKGLIGALAQIATLVSRVRGEKA